MAISKNKKSLTRRRLKRKLWLYLIRFSKRYRIEKYLIPCICVVIVLAIFKVNLLDRFELTLLDYRFNVKKAQPIFDKVVSIDMAQDSIDQIGRWPWDRSWHATLITALKQSNAQAVLYDVIFSEPSAKKEDLALKVAIENAGNIYLPYVFNIEEINSEQLITPNVIYGVDSYMESLGGAIGGTGFINIAPDVDGTLRRVPLIIEHDGRRHLQIAFKVACDLLGVREDEIIVKRGKYIRLPLKNGRRVIDIPIDNNYQMIINWPGTWKKAFKHFSFIDVIKSLRALSQDRTPIIPLESFSNKVCVVGMAVSGLMDTKPTPLEPLYPAMGIHTCILNNILRSDFCSEAPRGLIIGLIISLSLATGLYISLSHPVRDFLLTLGLMISYFAISALLFYFTQIWINIIYPSIAILLTYTGLTLYSQIRINVEKKQLFKMATTDHLTGLYQKRHFDTLMHTVFSDRRSAKKTKKLSVIMADIDHFKRINDTYGHLLGNVVIKTISRTIKSVCRPLDICARFGGEEFIVMLPNAGLKEATIIAERIRKAVEKKVYRYKNLACKATISLGVASLKREKKEDLLIEKADKALYAAKSQGRNKVCRG